MGKEKKELMIDKDLKTPYQWCIDSNLRVIDINEWPLEWYGSKEKHFFEFPTMDKEGFIEALSKCRVKPNSLQRKTEMYLEYRMYGLVPYNLSPIQQGIQFGHAVVELSRLYSGHVDEKIYNKWADKDKTFIILNGGTTNNNTQRLGSLNNYYNLLVENDIFVGPFFEPDLGDQLTAITFLVDERVYNKELYPDFQEETLPYNPKRKPSKKEETQLDERNESNYQKWVEKIGGPKNVFLREFLKNKRLA